MNHVIGSSNTFNSHYYSDGHLEGQFIPNRPSIVKCNNSDCGKFFNITDAIKIEQIDEYEIDAPEWKDVFNLSNYIIGVKELEEALQIRFYKDENEEIAIRTLLLRRYNDKYRKDENYQFSPSESESFNRNLIRLIRIYERRTSIEEILFLAELYRENGDFNSCILILDEISAEKGTGRNLYEKIYSQAKVKDSKVFDVNGIAVKMEYKCSNCGDSLILFDLDWANSISEHLMGYKHFICKNDSTVFSAPLKVLNPVNYYGLNFFQKLFKTKEPYSKFIANNITCPKCEGEKVEVFNPELQCCIQCNNGKYETIKWFD